MIDFTNVSLYRNSELVLEDIQLTLREQRIAIIGSNGSGKSSFARLINGLLVADTGEVLINSIDAAKEGKNIRQKVGFLFQNPEHQIIMPMVKDDIALSLKNQGVGKEERLAKAEEIMQKMEIEHLSERSSHMLSGGEKQLVALAGILIGNPEILVMDEPTTLLDLRHVNRLKKHLQAFTQQIIIITHDMNLATMCQRVIVLEKGKVVCDDLPEQAIAYYQQSMEEDE